jgi:hypothetical protein
MEAYQPERQALHACCPWKSPCKREQPSSHHFGRNLDQNAKFHALCEDLAKSGYQWAGKERTAEQWKVLLVSGHAMATKQGAEMVPGIEGEFVNLRESTARMSKARSSSLIEYTLAFCASNNIKLTDERIAA